MTKIYKIIKNRHNFQWLFRTRQELPIQWRKPCYFKKLTQNETKLEFWLIQIIRFEEKICEDNLKGIKAVIRNIDD